MTRQFWDWVCVALVQEGLSRRDPMAILGRPFVPFSPGASWDDCVCAQVLAIRPPQARNMGRKQLWPSGRVLGNAHPNSRIATRISPPAYARYLRTLAEPPQGLPT